MYFIKIDNKTIKYDIIRTKRKKTIGIHIDPDRGVIIRSPKKVSDAEIQKIVKKKSDWIFRKLDRIAQIKPAPKSKEYVSGEELLYLGKKYKLLVCKDMNLKQVFIRLDNNKIRVCLNPDILDVNKQEAIKAELISWYYGHLVHPNHSKEFWNKLASIVPDYKEREEWLRVNGRRLNI